MLFKVAAQVPDYRKSLKLRQFWHRGYCENSNWAISCSGLH